MKVKELVDYLFKNIAYSNTFQEIRNNILKALTEEYEKKITIYHNELIAYSHLIQEYFTLQNAGLLSGYTMEEIESWKHTEDIIDEKLFKKKHRISRIHILSFSFLTTLFLLYFILMCCFRKVIYLLPLGIFLPYPICFIIKFKSWVIQGKNFTYAVCNTLDHASSRYFKKTINSLILGIYALAIGVCLIFLTNFRGEEILSQFLTSLTVIEIFLFCIIKNVCYNIYYHFLMENPLEKGFKKHVIYLIGIAIGYWLVAGSVICLIGGDIGIILAILFSVLYFIFALVYILKFRGEITIVNLRFNKLRIVSIGTILLVSILYMTMRLDSWLIQPYINQIPAVETSSKSITYEEQTGIYTILATEEDFKILQLTDIHLGGSNFSYRKDKLALSAVYKLIEYTKPDLVIVTGDLVFPLGIMSFSFNNSAPIMQFASFMRNINIPWAFTYGNHDTESLAVLSEQEVDALFQSLSFKKSRNLLYPYIQPNIYGRNNQIIEIRNKENRLLQALFLLDSNSYTGKGFDSYDYIHEDQVAWYEKSILDLSKKEGKMISSLAFFHMPLQEYQEAYTLYKEGSDEVLYHFGKIGEKKETICISKHPSSLFSKAVELGSTKAMFCGHDHLNTISLTYQGIQLTYGLSIDYLAYPDIEEKTEQRGATLITLLSDSTFKVEQVALNSLNHF